MNRRFLLPLLVVVLACVAAVLPHRRAAFRSSGPTLDYQTGLAIWHKPETLSGSDGTRASQWDDSSGNNYHSYSLASTNEPYVTNSVLNGYAGLRFHKDDLSFMQVSNVVSGWTESHLFIVMKCDNDPAAEFQNAGFQNFNDHTTSGNVIWTDGQIYDKFAYSGTRLSKNPSPSLDSFFSYNICFRDSAGITNRINGASLSSNNSSASAAWADADHLHLGASYANDTRYWGANVIVEVLLYDHLLEDADRDTVETYLNDKYGIY